MELRKTINCGFNYSPCISQSSWSRLYLNIREFFCPNLSAANCLERHIAFSVWTNATKKKGNLFVMFILAKTENFYVKRTNIMIAVNVTKSGDILSFCLSAMEKGAFSNLLLFHKLRAFVDGALWIVYPFLSKCSSH